VGPYAGGQAEFRRVPYVGGPRGEFVAGVVDLMPTAF